MISEILLIGQISEQAPGTLLLRTGQTESKRETEGRGKHLQTQGGCHEKVELFESNEVFEGLYKSSINLHPTPCSLLNLIPLSPLSSFCCHIFSKNIWPQMLTQLRLRVDLVCSSVASGRMALGEGCERWRRLLYEGLSRGLIYEHPDQWVN